MTSPTADLSALPEGFRFWVDVDDETGCWMWAGTINPDGTGVWKRDGVQKRARRWAWELSGRAIPAGTRVYRTCREELCVNPDHAEATTMRDRVLGMNLGQNVGENNPTAILTEKDVLAIRQWYRDGMSAQACAARSGMGESTIHSVLSGRTWRHITGGENIIRSKAELMQAAPVPTYVTETRKMYASGMTYIEIRAELGVSYGTINGILTGRTWKHVTGGTNIVRPPGRRKSVKEAA